MHADFLAVCGHGSDGAVPQLVHTVQNLRFAWKQLSGWRWTVIKTVANLFFSELGLSAIQYLANYSLFYTRTQSVGSMVTKIAVFQLINSFAVPLAAFSWDHWMNNLLNGVKGTSVGRRLWCAPPPG